MLLFERISVDAGADGWERHAAKLFFAGDLERPSIAGRQQFGFASVTAVPHRPDRVNDVARRQVVPLGKFRVSGFATTQGATFLQASRVRRHGEWRHQHPRRRAERSLPR